MVKTLKEPGPWLFCYSLTVVSCPSPLVSRPTQVSFFSGLELAWQVSDQPGRCGQLFQGRSPDCQDSGRCPWAPLCGAVLGLHVMCPAPALRRACSLQPHRGSQHLIMLHCLHPLGPSWLCDSSWSKKCLMKDWGTVQGLLKVYF